MAEGYRLYHPSPELRGKTVRLRHAGGMEPDGRLRGAKVYEMAVDSDGFTMVSETVWQRVQEAQLRNRLHEGHRFTLVEIVKDPPTLQLGGAGPDTRFATVSGDGIRDTTSEVQQHQRAGGRRTDPDLAF